MHIKNIPHITQRCSWACKPLTALCLSTAVLVGTPVAIAASAECSNSIVATDAHRLICTELGITPEVMAVFGMNSVDANAAFDRIDELNVEITSLRSMQTQLATKTRSLKQTQKDARTAQTQGDAQRLNADSEQLKADMESLSASIETKQDQIRAAILPAETDALMIERVCEPVGMAAFVPVEFRVMDLLESDYAELLPALMAEKRAIANNEQVDTDSQLVLSRFRRLPAIESARSNLLYNLDAVRGAFDR